MDTKRREAWGLILAISGSVTGFFTLLRIPYVGYLWLAIMVATGWFLLNIERERPQDKDKPSKMGILDYLLWRHYRQPVRSVLVTLELLFWVACLFGVFVHGKLFYVVLIMLAIVVVAVAFRGHRRKLLSS